MFQFRMLNPSSGDPMPPVAVAVDDPDPGTLPPAPAKLVNLCNVVPDVSSLSATDLLNFMNP